MRSFRLCFSRAAIALMLLSAAALSVQAQDLRYDPPWHSPPEAGVNFTIPGIDNVPDLYGDIHDPQLVVFFAGNQYMVVDELINAFKKAYPQYERVFAETLPPGILFRQIETGSLVIGNLRIAVRPDVYTAGRSRVEENLDIFSRTVSYTKNKLAIMVGLGNPLQIRSLRDLGRKDVRVSMPNPSWEGIGRKIEEAYVLAGGQNLKTQIMDVKRAEGSTILTKIHHRQTPLNILYRRADAGPVWLSEALYHTSLHPVDLVEIPDSENVSATYMAGSLKAAPHPAAADDFLNFLSGQTALAIYQKYGFQRP